MQLFRIGIKLKETDKRKNASVWRYVIMATTLDEAKTLAVAAWVDPERYTYQTKTLDRIAQVFGHAMGTVAYGCDNYGERDKTEHLETVPSLEAVRAARAVIDAFEQAHEEPEAVAAS